MRPPHCGTDPPSQSKSTSATALASSKAARSPSVAGSASNRCPCAWNSSLEPRYSGPRLLLAPLQGLHGFGSLQHMADTAAAAPARSAAPAADPTTLRHLRFICLNGDVHDFRKFMERHKSIDLNLVVDTGRDHTPLMLACDNPQATELVRILVEEFRVDVNSSMVSPRQGASVHCWLASTPVLCIIDRRVCFRAVLRDAAVRAQAHAAPHRLQGRGRRCDNAPDRQRG